MKRLNKRVICMVLLVIFATLSLFSSGGLMTADAAEKSVIVSIDKNTSSYKKLAAITDPGTLTSDSRVSGILSDFKAADGKTGLNHPNGIASDGKVFVVCDTWNNRVLIYNTLPKGNQAPDVVIGQKDFTHFGAGKGLDELNWPVSATFSEKKLLIADTHNNRILVFNSVPTKNGAAADAEITMISENNNIKWPWAVWSDGTKLVITSTMGGSIAFWDNVSDAISGKFASFNIETKGTPRTIITDGNFLLVGDHNMNGGGQHGSHVWKSFPKSANDKPDFTIDTQYGGCIINGNFYGVANDSHIYVYDGVIDSANEKPVGDYYNTDDYMQCGDYNQIIYAGKKTYLSCYNSSVIAIFKGVLTKKKYGKPLGYLGADEKTKSTTVDRGIYQNPIAAVSDKSMVIADDYNRLLCVYKKIPKTNNAIADFVYRFDATEFPVDIEIDNDGKLFVLTGKSLLVWDKVPTKGQNYTKRYALGEEIGNINACLAVDDKFVYIVSEYSNTLYKFKKTAKSFKLTKASKKVSLRSSRNIFSNGKYLLSANANEGKIEIYNVSDLSFYGEIKGEGFDPGSQLSQPGSAIITTEGKLVIADSDYDRLLIYNSMGEAIKDFKSAIIVGQLDNYKISSYSLSGFPMDETPSIKSTGSLFTPTSLTYRDGHLWVGEFKFSSRLLRYDLK